MAIQKPTLKIINDKLPKIDLQLPNNIVSSIIEYEKVREQEKTKREKIDKDYKETIRKLDVVEKFISNEIEKKSIQNLIIIEKTFQVIDKLIENGNTEKITILIEQLSDLKYITEENVEVVKSILGTDKDNKTIDIYMSDY